MTVCVECDCRANVHAKLATGPPCRFGAGRLELGEKKKDNRDLRGGVGCGRVATGKWAGGEKSRKLGPHGNLEVRIEGTGGSQASRGAMGLFTLRLCGTLLALDWYVEQAVEAGGGAHSLGGVHPRSVS